MLRRGAWLRSSPLSSTAPSPIIAAKGARREAHALGKPDGYPYPDLREHPLGDSSYHDQDGRSPSRSTVCYLVVTLGVSCMTVTLSQCVPLALSMFLLAIPAHAESGDSP